MLIRYIFSLSSVILASVAIVSCAQIEDPCKTKSRVVADDKYCDKYWECDNGQSIQYDCPNGLVFAGKHRGVTEGCDYPWRSNYCEYPKAQISKYSILIIDLKRH